MDAARCEAGRTTTVNKVVRNRTRPKDFHIPVVALWRELGIPPVRADVAARRARAWFKLPYLKAWIGTLCEREAPKSRKGQGAGVRA